MSDIFNRIVFTAIIMVLLSCASSDLISKKEQVWRDKLEVFQPIGKTKKELFDWRNENGVPLNSYTYKEGIILETINGDGLVCSKWNIFLSIELDANKKIASYSVSSAGTCL
jgi:hypothetical protein